MYLFQQYLIERFQDDIGIIKLPDRGFREFDRIFDNILKNTTNKKYLIIQGSENRSFIDYSSEIDLIGLLSEQKLLFFHHTLTMNKPVTYLSPIDVTNTPNQKHVLWGINRSSNSSVSIDEIDFYNNNKIYFFGVIPLQVTELCEAALVKIDCYNNTLFDVLYIHNNSFDRQHIYCLKQIAWKFFDVII